MIVPPGCTIRIDDRLSKGQRLPDIPPIAHDLSEEEAEEIRKMIAKNISGVLLKNAEGMS